MRAKGMLPLIGAALFFAVAAILVPAQRAPNGSTRNAASTDKIGIGSTSAYYSLPILVAEDQGYFARHGLDATVDLYETGAVALKALVQNRIDFATASEFGFVTESLDAGSGGNLRIIASLATSFSEELIARKDRGILTLADLRGKRVGSQRNSALDFSLYRFLILQRIPPEAVSHVNLTYAQCLEAIVRGEIDATVLFDYQLYLAKKRLGSNLVSWPARSAQDYYWLLVGKKEGIETHPAVSERLLAALLEAQEYIRAHRGEAESLLVKRWGRDPQFLPVARVTSKLEIALEQALIVAMEDEADWLSRRDPAGKTSPPDYLHLISMDALNAVKPRANTILR